MWELGHKEGWVPKNWCFQTVVLEKTPKSPLGSKEIKPVHPKGNQLWIFTGTTEAEIEAPILWSSDVKNWLIGKDPDAGKDWRQEEKGRRRGWQRMPFNHLILYHPLLFLLSIFPSIRYFSNELALCIRWPKYCSFSFSNSISFSISPSNEYSGLISFRNGWFDLLAVQGTLKNLLQHHSLKASILWHSAFFMVQLTPVHDYWKNHSFYYTDLCWQSHVSPF